MAEITAALVKELRGRTGLGMMECKKALEEAGGDIKKAEELLRIKSGAKASKAASRIAADGAVATWLSPDAKLGAMVELNCETDFVAKNADFMTFANTLAEMVAKENPPTSPRSPNCPLGACRTRRRSKSARQSWCRRSARTSPIRRFERVKSEGKTRAVRAPGIEDRRHRGPRGFRSGGQGCRDAHRVRQAPSTVAKDQYPADEVAAERKILEARAAESGKPPRSSPKWSTAASTNSSPKPRCSASLSSRTTSRASRRCWRHRTRRSEVPASCVVGEGIEKKKDDFAAEVAARAG